MIRPTTKRRHKPHTDPGVHGNRPLYRGTCQHTGKVCWNSRKDARTVAKQHNNDLSAYHCDPCGFWHLGHLPVTVARGEEGRENYAGLNKCPTHAVLAYPDRAGARAARDGRADEAARRGWTLEIYKCGDGNGYHVRRFNPPGRIGSVNGNE